jgi:trk system potassium uptake protein TrkA
LFNTPRKVARLRSSDYTDIPSLLDANNFAVDFSICPEQIVTDYIVKLIEIPEALQVLEFALGLVSLAAVRAIEGDPLIGHPLSDIRKRVPHLDARVVAIYRQDQPIIPEGDTIIEVGDEVFVLAATRDIRLMMIELRRMDKPCRRLMIVGGGNIGYRLAGATQGKYNVKLIERDERRARFLGSNLPESLVLHGDGTDDALLNGESIQDMDFFLALTNDDESNIMAALLAKALGARRVLALINRSVYVDVVQSDSIDIAISPALISIGSLLAHVRRGDVAAVHSLRRGAAEALELVVHGDASNSKVIGKRVEQLALPRGVTLGAIVRGIDEGSARNGDAQPEVLIAHHDIVIEPRDHVILLAVDKQLVHKIEKLFQVGLTYF